MPARPLARPELSNFPAAVIYNESWRQVKEFSEWKVVELRPHGSWLSAVSPGSATPDHNCGFSIRENSRPRIFGWRHRIVFARFFVSFLRKSAGPEFFWPVAGLRKIDNPFRVFVWKPGRRQKS